MPGIAEIPRIRGWLTVLGGAPGFPDVFQDWVLPLLLLLLLLGAAALLG